MTKSQKTLEAVVQDRALPTDYEHVDHPKHYGQHPSGVECIDLAEVLSFNIGSAFKYVYRRSSKANTVQDLEKARWYIVREIERLASFSKVPFIQGAKIVANAHFSLWHDNLGERIVRAETNKDAQGFYCSIFTTTGPDTYIQCLGDSLQYLDALIAEAVKASSPKSKSKPKSKPTPKTTKEQ